MMPLARDQLQDENASHPCETEHVIAADRAGAS